jgi:hypothetical protein
MGLVPFDQRPGQIIWKTSNASFISHVRVGAVTELTIIIIGTILELNNPIKYAKFLVHRLNYVVIKRGTYRNNNYLCNTGRHDRVTVSLIRICGKLSSVGPTVVQLFHVNCIATF